MPASLFLRPHETCCTISDLSSVSVGVERLWLVVESPFSISCQVNLG